MDMIEKGWEWRTDLLKTHDPSINPFLQELSNTSRVWDEQKVPPPPLPPPLLPPPLPLSPSIPWKGVNRVKQRVRNRERQTKEVNDPFPYWEERSTRYIHWLRDQTRKDYSGYTIYWVWSTFHSRWNYSLLFVLILKWGRRIVGEEGRGEGREREERRSIHPSRWVVVL